MKTLLNPELILSPTNSIFPIKTRNSTHFDPRAFLKLRFDDRHHWIGRRKLSTTVKALLDSTTVEQFGIPEFDVRNPSLSSSYRSSALAMPNQTVLDAQTRVCTGPTQTRPLDEQQAFKVFDTILRSGFFFSFVLRDYVICEVFVMITEFLKRLIVGFCYSRAC